VVAVVLVVPLVIGRIKKMKAEVEAYERRQNQQRA